MKEFFLNLRKLFIKKIKSGVDCGGFLYNFARRGAKSLRVKYIKIKFFAHFASLREVFLYNFAHRGAKGAKGEMDVAGINTLVLDR